MLFIKLMINYGKTLSNFGKTVGTLGTTFRTLSKSVGFVRAAVTLLKGGGLYKTGQLISSSGAVLLPRKGMPCLRY